LNLNKLTDFAITIVLAAALAGNLDSFTKWVYVARAKLLYDSRTGSWGPPDFFSDAKTNASKLQRHSSHRH
jgi:hypothetical protein